MIKKIIISFILFLICITNTIAQEQNSGTVDSLRYKIDSLCDIFLTNPSPTVRLKAAKDCEIFLIEEVRNEKELFFNFPLDSLLGVNRLVSPDNEFLILNWATPQENGNHAYFGIIVYPDGNYTVLKEGIHEDYFLDQEILDADNWFGEIYYKIIVTSNDDKRYYTMLGWNGNGFAHNRKTIDILTFPESQKPQFGAKIFDDPALSSRVIFKYNKNASMSLRYEEQRFTPENRKKSVEEDVIVFDHLVPMGSSIGAGGSQNVPSFIFDAYRWESGMWIFMEDIDARNSEQPRQRKESDEKVELNLFGN